jgi:hypothetical protein
MHDLGHPIYLRLSSVGRLVAVHLIPMPTRRFSPLLRLVSASLASHPHTAPSFLAWPHLSCASRLISASSESASLPSCWEHAARRIDKDLTMCRLVGNAISRASSAARGRRVVLARAFESRILQRTLCVRFLSASYIPARRASYLRDTQRLPI